MIYRVLKQAVRGKFSLPVHLILHVTYKCNSGCLGCFNRENLNKGKRELETREFELISRGLGDILWLHISGGEPFLRDDLAQICRMFHRNNHPGFISIPTSGLIPGRVEEIAGEILGRINAPLAIDVALDGIGAQHDEIRGFPGSFDLALQTYQRLRALKRKFKNLSTKITTVISNKNIGNLEEICRFVRRNMEDLSFHTLIFLRGNIKNKDIFLPPLGELLAKRNLLLKTWEEYSYDSNLGYAQKAVANAAHRMLLDLYFEMMKENKSCVRCLAGLSHAVIGADAEVAFCELLHGVGNLRDYGFDFRKLWYSEKARKMRGYVRSGKCWCTHGCVHMDNIFLNLKMYPRIMKYALGYFLRKIARRNRVGDER